MGRFTAQQSFNRGEVAPEFHDRTDIDFYGSAVAKLSNWVPLPAGGIQTRPGMVRVSSSIPGTERAFFNIAPTNADNWELLLDKSACIVQEVNGGILWCYFVWAKDPSTSGPSAEIRLHVTHGTLFNIPAGGYSGTFTDEAILATSAPLYEHYDRSVQSVEDIPPLSQDITVATVGPAMFVAAHFFFPQRFFIQTASSITNYQNVREQVQFYEELLGTVDLENGSTTVTGVDTLFFDQLGAGMTVLIEGQTYEVANVTSAEEFTLTTAYTGLSVSGVRIAKQVSYPFGNAFTGRPRLVTFYKSRIIYFATKEKPTGMWASKPNDPFTIVPGSVHDNAPIQAELLATGLDEFRWVMSSNVLLLGSAHGEYLLQVDSDGPLTPTNFSLVRIGANGGSTVPPALLEAGAVYVSRDSSQIFYSQFDFARQGFASNDLALFAPHLLTDSISAIAYRPSKRGDPANRLFFLLADGTVRIFTFDEVQGIQAWSRFDYEGGETDGVPTNISSIYATNGSVFFLTHRGTDYATLCYLGEDRSRVSVGGGHEWPEILDFDFPAFFGTGGGTRNDTDPLRVNRYVGVYSTVMGYLGTFENVDGVVTLPATVPGGELYIGVPYRPECDLLPATSDTQQGVLLNRRRRLIRTLVSVRETAQLNINGIAQLGDIPPVQGRELFTGVLEQRQLGWVIKERSHIDTPGIFRATVLSLTREIGI